MTVTAFPESLSSTHSHILAVLAGEMQRRRPAAAVIRVLDVGCGDARLLDFLAAALPLVLTDKKVELYGFDIAGHATQPADFFDEALKRLQSNHPETDWSSRLHLIREGDAWPFEDGSFDAVVSNQVLEHVADADLYFSELARLLSVGGISVHLFPSHHVIIEPHLLTPFVHWFGNVDLMRRWLALWARTGHSAYGRWEASQPETARSVERYARVHADFLQRFTYYRTQRQLLQLVKTAGLHGSFSATPGYLSCALARRFGGTVRRVAPPPPPIRNAAATLLLRYLTSVTLVTSQDADYTVPMDTPAG